MRVLILFLLIISFEPSEAQKFDKLRIQVNYGLNGNFFVRSYDERTFANGATQFLNKNFLGRIGGIDLSYKIGRNLLLGIGFDRSSNTRVVSFQPQTAPVFIRDFTISHWNNFYNLLLTKEIIRKKYIFLPSIGAYYLRSQQQEIDVSNQGVSFDQRNFKNSRLEELGALAAFEFQYQIDTRTYLGVRTRFYFTVSTGTPEAITLTPTLSYHF